MLVCTCCENPVVTNNLENAIEIPSGFPLYPSHGCSFEVLQADLEACGLVWLFNAWHAPDLSPIEGVYILQENRFRER